MEEKPTILQIRLKEQLEKTGEKPTPLSLKLGFSNSFLRDILRGKTKVPSAENLQKIASALGTTPDYLLGKTDTKADRLRAARVGAGFSSTADAANFLDVSASTYRAHENGQNDFNDERAQFYARMFNVDPVYLILGRRTETDTHTQLPNATIAPKISFEGGTKIPLYGHAVGGVDGEFVLNGNKLDDITAPPSLLGIHNAYAVTVSGDSMEPRYEDGETLFVDPRKRVTRGDYVVAQVQLEENGPIYAYVKKFVRHNAKELVLTQFNPVKELTFPHECVISVDYVVMGGRVY